MELGEDVNNLWYSLHTLTEDTLIIKVHFLCEPRDDVSKVKIKAIAKIIEELELPSDTPTILHTEQVTETHGETYTFYTLLVDYSKAYNSQSIRGFFTANPKCKTCRLRGGSSSCEYCRLKYEGGESISHMEKE